MLIAWIILLLTSCKTVYIDKYGNSHNTWNKDHIDKVNKYRPFGLVNI